MNVLSIIIICLIAGFLSVLLKQYKPEYGMFLSIAAGAGVLMLIVSAATPIFDQVQALVDRMGISSEYFVLLMKSLGICYIAQLACDACKDAGEGSMASKIELAAKVAILVLALPVFSEIIDVVLQLVS